MSQYNNADGRLRGRKAVARRLRLWSINPYCAMCGKLTVYPDGFELDHKHPIYKGGSEDDSNLQILHPECHLKKTAKDMGHVDKAKFDKDGRVEW